MRSFKRGALVKYKSKPGVPLHRIGLVLTIEGMIEVRWVDHMPSDRNWYMKSELKVLNEGR